MWLSIAGFVSATIFALITTVAVFRCCSKLIRIRYYHNKFIKRMHSKIVYSSDSMSQSKLWLTTCSSKMFIVLITNMFCKTRDIKPIESFLDVGMDLWKGQIEAGLQSSLEDCPSTETWWGRKVTKTTLHLLHVISVKSQVQQMLDNLYDFSFPPCFQSEAVF